MLCDQVREHLSAYLDKELTADLSAAVRAHLDTCAECRALADELRATVGLLGRLPVRAAPKHLADDVMREIERRGILAGGAPLEPQPQERTLPMRRARLWPRALAVAATLALAVGISIFAYLSDMGRKAPPATELASARKEVRESEVSGSGTLKALPRPAAPTDGYALHDVSAPAKAPAAAARDLDLLADTGKKAEVNNNFVVRKDSKGNASQMGFFDARAGDVAVQEAVQAVTLAKAGDGASDYTLAYGGGAGQPTLDLSGMNAYAGATVVQLHHGGTLALFRTAGGQAVIDNLQMGGGGLAYPTGGTLTITGAPAGSDATPKLGSTSLGTLAATAINKAGAVPAAPAMPPTELQVTAGAYGAAMPSAARAVAQPPSVSMGRAKSADLTDLALPAGRPTSGPAPTRAAAAQTEAASSNLFDEGAITRSGAQAAGGTRYLRLPALQPGRDRAPLEKAMLAAAGGEVGTEQISRVATSDALRAADNQLVLSVESPDEAHRNLVELFKAAGWHALAVDRELKEEAGRGRRSGEDRSLAEGKESLMERRLPPGGVYYRATRNGEDVWLVLADRDSLSRFGSRLAQAQGLPVGAGSSAEFLAIRGLQTRLRSSEYAKEKELAPRISVEKRLGEKDLAMKSKAAAPAAKPAAGRQEAEGISTDKLASGKSAVDLKQTLERSDLHKEAAKPAAPAPWVAPSEPAPEKPEQAAPALPPLPEPTAPAAPAAPAMVAGADQPKKSAFSYYQDQGGGRGGSAGIGGGGASGGVMPAKNAPGSSTWTMESKPKAEAAAAAPASVEARKSAPLPDDRILLVIRVQPVVADRAETVPAATRPAEKH